MKKQKKDKDRLSSHNVEICKFAGWARDISSVRKERVEAVKKQIESGTYDVSAKSVANSIVDLHRSLKSEE